MRSKLRMRQRLLLCVNDACGSSISCFDNCAGGVVLAKAAFSNIMNATSYCKLSNVTQLVQLIGNKS
jgi:hypothetical protein